MSATKLPPGDETMTTRRALALSAAALDEMAQEATDVREWRQAARVVRGVLHLAQGLEETESSLRTVVLAVLADNAGTGTGVKR